MQEPQIAGWFAARYRAAAATRRQPRSLAAGFYRFTPTAYPDLSAGTLEIAEATPIGANEWTVTWHVIADPDSNSTETRYQVAQSSPFNGGEGIATYGNIVTFATRGDPGSRPRVVQSMRRQRFSAPEWMPDRTDDIAATPVDPDRPPRPAGTEPPRDSDQSGETVRAGDASQSGDDLATLDAVQPAIADVIDDREGELIDEEDRIDSRGERGRVAPSERPIEYLGADAPPETVPDLPEDALGGTVIAVHGDHFRVSVHHGKTEIEHEIDTWVVFLPRKMLIRERRYRHPVAVGDRVIIQPQPTDGADTEPQAQLIAIRERRSWLSRPAARNMKRRRNTYREEMEQVVVANVDQVIVVMACSPEISEVRTNLVDRFLVAAERGGMKPAVLFNKADLIPEAIREDYEDVLELYRSLGYRAGLASAKDHLGVDLLAGWLKDRTTVFAGPSGVGKSSLLNAVQPGLELKVGDVNRRTGRGRHTTTTVHLLPLHLGGYVVDTPGIREFGLHELDPADVYKYFPEIEELAEECQFRDCAHTPGARGCMVLEALEEGGVSDRRYVSFLALRESLES